VRGEERLHPHAVVRADEDRLRAALELGEGALHDDAAVIDDRDRVADLLHLVEQAGFPRISWRRGVESGRRLVEEDELGVADEREVEPAELARRATNRSGEH